MYILGVVNVICLQDEAFYKLVEEVVERLLPNQATTQSKWIGLDECMALLNVKSKTTIQKLRDEGKIRFSQPQKRIILYDRDSIEEYLEIHAKNTF